MSKKVKIMLKKAKSESLGVCFFMKNDPKSERIAWKVGFMQRLAEIEKKVRIRYQENY